MRRRNRRFARDTTGSISCVFFREDDSEQSVGMVRVMLSTDVAEERTVAWDGEVETGI